MIRVELAGQEALNRAEKLLSNIPGGVEKAVRSAMSRTVSGLRANTVKAARERYDIKAGDVRTNEAVRVRYSYQNGVQADILFSGKRIPLHRFGGSAPKVPTPGQAARGHVLKSTSPTRFLSAFVAQMKSGHIGIFERTGGKNSAGRDEIRELISPSVPQMLGSEQVTERLDKIAAERFSKEFEHAVDAILKGYF